MTNHKKWFGLAVGVLGLVVVGAIAAGQIQARRLRIELERVRQAMAGGRFGAARKDLAGLARQWPGRGEILYLLGRCEEALGRPEKALAAWEHIPAGDTHDAQAAESRGSVLMNLGRLAPAESCLVEALRRVAATDRYPLLRAMARLLRLEGRYVEVSEALIAAWAGAPDPSELLQELWKNDTEPVPVDGWKVLLDAADDQDDRVWLGRARHATLTGRFDEARSWLRRCLERRGDDPTVWRACLDLAVAAEDSKGFWQAAGRIPTEVVSPWEIAVFRAWLATRSGDPQTERRETMKLVEQQAAPSRALERLAGLAREAGDRKEAEQLQRRKAEIDRAKDRVHKLVALRLDFREHARELAELSAVLGRPFDQHAWSLVASVAPGASRAPDTNRELEHSRAVCRAASETARAHLLGRTAGSRPRPDRGVPLADPLADLRLDPGQGRHPVMTDPDPHDVRHSASRARAHFIDDAEAAGLRFAFNNGRSPRWLLPETLSGGVALIDFDGDGWLDVYCIQGGSIPEGDAPATRGTAFPVVGRGTAFPAVKTHGQDARATEVVSDPGPEGRATELGDRLFRNQHDGTFRDVTARSGIERLARSFGYGMGVAVGDYDNDGDADLFLTRLDRYVLLHNRGDGTFEDATERAGLAGMRENPTSAAFADLDGDGDLDLYVCHYARWDPGHLPRCRNDRGEDHYCDPAKYERAVDHVFRNEGGRFLDVTERSGFTDPDGRGLGVIAADLDDDRRIDLYVANDGTANCLFRNLGGFQFEETALTAGVAGSAEGGYQAGMGLAAADLDGDGRLDLLITNFYGEGTTLHHNLGQGLFDDRSAGSGILAATRYWLGFGIAVFDAANRGRPFVAIANGHVNDLQPFYPYAMPSRLYEGREGGRLFDISDMAGPPWAVPRVGRGLAAGDLDHDGRVDLVIVAQDGPLAYFHNRTERAGHFILFRLEGTSSNRDGVGARVVVTHDRGLRRHVAQRVGGGSYLTASDGRLHFGLGPSTSIDSVEVRWPSGRLDRWTNLAADTGYRLREGDMTAPRLPGWNAPRGNGRRTRAGSPEERAHEEE